MKKTFLIPVILFCLPLFCLPQSDSDVTSYKSNEAGNSFIAHFSTHNSSRIFLNEVNIKAVRDFIKRFKNISNANWYKVSDGFIVSFTENAIETKVIYYFNGNWRSMLRTYSEDKLPYEVRDLVKSKYYDYNIMVVYEITHTDNITYIIKIEDSKKLKTLSVSDGNIEVIGDYVRG